MNILICSAGRRVKLIQYFQEELNKIGGKIIAADCDSTAPALSYSDISVIVPPITHPDYIQTVIKLCKEYKIEAVISLIDPELSLLAHHRLDFESENIKVIVSNSDVVTKCFDKFNTYNFLHAHNIPVVPVYENIYEVLIELERKSLNFPLIVKPRHGSASIGIRKVYTIKELQFLLQDTTDLIIQPFIEGKEYGIDCYIDLITREATNIFCKRKLKMRAGETDKSESVIDLKLFKMIKELIKVMNLVGPIDVDCFETESGYLISEINPRFGGGYPHAHESGQNFVKNIIQNLQGIPNKRQLGEYQEGTTMIKFDHVRILPPQMNPQREIALNDLNIG